MFGIAEALKKTAPVEFLLYMWQAEDMLRACGVDAGLLVEKLLPQGTAQQKEEARTWYGRLADTLKDEQKTNGGHISELLGFQRRLETLHDGLMKTQNCYAEEVKPVIEALNAACLQKEVTHHPVEKALRLMYGVWLMRTAGKEVKAADEQLQKEVAKMLRNLSDACLASEHR